MIAQYPDISDPTWGQGFVDGLEILKRGKVAFTPYIDDTPMAQARAEGDHAVSHTYEFRARDMVQAWNENLDKQVLAAEMSATQSVNKRKKTP